MIFFYCCFILSISMSAIAYNVISFIYLIVLLVDSPWPLVVAISTLTNHQHLFPTQLQQQSLFHLWWLCLCSWPSPCLLSCPLWLCHSWSFPCQVCSTKFSPPPWLIFTWFRERGDMKLINMMRWRESINIILMEFIHTMICLYMHSNSSDCRWWQRRRDMGEKNLFLLW